MAVGWLNREILVHFPKAFTGGRENNEQPETIVNNATKHEECYYGATLTSVEEELNPVRQQSPK